MDLEKIISKAAIKAINEGIVINDSPLGSIHRWVKQKCSYNQEHEFYIVFLIACEMADIQAKKEGYKSNADKAATEVFKHWKSDRFGKFRRT